MNKPSASFGLDVNQLRDPRPLYARHKKTLELFLTRPLGRVIRYRDFYDAGIPLYSLRRDILVLRRALKVHGFGFTTFHKRGYALIRMENPH